MDAYEESKCSIVGAVNMVINKYIVFMKIKINVSSTHKGTTL